MNLPYTGTRGISIQYVGRFVQLKTPYGLTVNYDGNYYLSVSLPKKFSGKIEGNVYLFFPCLAGLNKILLLK